MKIEDIKENYYFETLNESHYLNDFDCGDEDLNDFLKNDALIQQDKVKWLQDNDELEQFIEQKFETYAKNTILGRLDKVTDEEKAECESIVKDMLNVFAPFYKGEDEILLNAMEITKVQLEELENEQLSQSELDISQKQLKKITTTSRKKKRR